MAYEFDGDGHDVVVQKGTKGGQGVCCHVLYEFRVKLCWLRLQCVCRFHGCLTSYQVVG